MAANILQGLKKRRSIYGISKNIPVTEAYIEELVAEAVKHTPSSFNSQSARVVVLFGEQHDKLWTITKETLRKIVPAESFSSTEEKIGSFQSGYGTVLFFEDQAVVENLQAQFALYKDNFPIWSNQSSGMLQLVVWTALAEEGIGASLQHYNPLIDEEVKQTWNLPASWKLIAQLPFGTPTAEPGDKAFQPIEERLKVFK
ncbi:nitroreductase family protein [Gorillibacterium sp. CAU 1737]|uniref:nitroreductase family protein n=1 Tax=Gorillibacterium sp. CAU 1737 TaxID=3140362 RepID=UPI003260455C